MRFRPVSRVVALLAFLAGTALAAGCGQGSTSPSAGTTPGAPAADKKASPEAAPTKVDFTLTSQEIAKDFETDKAAALKKYKDKWVEVEGPMESVLVLPSGDVNIRLVGFQADPNKFDFHSIRGVPPEKERERLKSLTPGQKVKLRGKVDRDTSGFIDLVPCEVVSVGPDPAIAVTANQLTEDYAKDTQAADDRYKDKWLLVEGVVSELSPAEMSVVLEGAGKKDGKPLRVLASYPANRKDDFAALKKGDKVKIKGQCGGEFLGSIPLTAAGLVK